MPVALIYRWVIFVLLIIGLILLMKHKVLTPFVFWSRIQYYTFSTFTLFVLWLGATLMKVDMPVLYTADFRYAVAASLGTLSLMYHLIVRPGAIRTHHDHMDGLPCTLCRLRLLQGMADDRSPREEPSLSLHLHGSEFP